MTIYGHRYLDPHWWFTRLAEPLERVLDPPIVMSLMARSALISGEPELRRLAEWVYPDRISVDVGAANGVYSWHLERISTRVCAFEANPQLVPALRRRLPKVTIYNCALSNEDGEASLRVPKLKNMLLTGHATIDEANALEGFNDLQAISVSKVRFDGLDIGPVGFIKLDVEGHELEVLKGAELCLLRDRPILLIEIEERHRKGAFQCVSEWLYSRGYLCDENQVSPQNFLFRSKLR